MHGNELIEVDRTHMSAYQRHDFIVVHRPASSFASRAASGAVWVAMAIPITSKNGPRRNPVVTTSDACWGVNSGASSRLTEKSMEPSRDLTVQIFEEAP